MRLAVAYLNFQLLKDFHPQLLLIFNKNTIMTAQQISDMMSIFYVFEQLGTTAVAQGEKHEVKCSLLIARHLIRFCLFAQYISYKYLFLN